VLPVILPFFSTIPVTKTRTKSPIVSQTAAPALPVEVFTGSNGYNFNIVVYRVISSTFENRGYRTLVLIDGHAYQIVGCETLDDGTVWVTTDVTSASIDITVASRDDIDHSLEIVIGADLAIENDTQPFAYFSDGWVVSFSSGGVRFTLGLQFVDRNSRRSATPVELASLRASGELD
jgi:hypothetical protein